MPAPKQLLVSTESESDPFFIYREKAFILLADLPAGATAHLEIKDPTGVWRDISGGDGVRFEAPDFDSTATKPASLKFFYAAPMQSYRLTVSVAGAVAWLLYGGVPPGAPE